MPHKSGLDLQIKRVIHHFRDLLSGITQLQSFILVMDLLPIVYYRSLPLFYFNAPKEPESLLLPFLSTPPPNGFEQIQTNRFAFRSRIMMVVAHPHSFQYLKVIPFPFKFVPRPTADSQKGIISLPLFHWPLTRSHIIVILPLCGGQKGRVHKMRASIKHHPYGNRRRRKNKRIYLFMLKHYPIKFHHFVFASTFCFDNSTV